MPEGTYNSFSQTGSIVENPRHAAYLVGKEDEKLGGDLRGVSVQEAAEYLSMRVLGKPFGDVKEYVEENRPSVGIIKDDGEEAIFEWDESEGDYVRAERE